MQFKHWNYEGIDCSDILYSRQQIEKKRKKKQPSTKISVAGTKVILKCKERGTGGTCSEWKTYSIKLVL